MIRIFFILFLALNFLNAADSIEELVAARDYINKGEFSKALEILVPLVKKENPQALNMMGWLYMNGKGVKKDEKKGFVFYFKSAEKGFSKAYYSLGMSYEYGIGAGIDIEKAIYYYKKGYSSGDPKSAFALGKLYVKGCKTEKDIDKGIKYLKYSCRKKIAKACYMLGNVYEVEFKNEKKAEKYYVKAGKLGYVEGYRKAGDMFFL